MAPQPADMGRTDGAARVAVPAGWIEVGPGPEAPTTQRIAPADWPPSAEPRPTMTVTTVPTATEPSAARVIADAQAGLHDVVVMSVDPWHLPGGTGLGWRLALVHTEGRLTVTTLVWTVSTDATDVVVRAQAESTSLHRHERAFAEALAGLRLPGEPEPEEQPIRTDLLRRTPPGGWADVLPSDHRAPAGIVSDPDSRILVEASVGRSSLRFDATLAGDRATVSATASPRTVPDPHDGEALTTFELPVSLLAVSVARWLGLGPAWTPATAPLTIPTRLLMSRLADPGVAPPAGADPVTWAQPWFLWTFRSSATDSGLVMVDADASGQCAVMETHDEQMTRFAPLSSYNVWLTMNWLISESLDARS